jgi:hypothetical protein
VGNGDAAADPGRAEVLTPLEHLEQHAFRFFVQFEQADQLAQHVILGGAGQVELDCIFTEELAQFHRLPDVGARSSG